MIDLKKGVSIGTIDGIPSVEDDVTRCDCPLLSTDGMEMDQDEMGWMDE